MPLALPLRSAGALDIKAFMFGAWKKPNPHPQIAIRQTMSATCGLIGSNANRTIPDRAMLGRGHREFLRIAVG